MTEKQKTCLGFYEDYDLKDIKHCKIYQHSLFLAVPKEEYDKMKEESDLNYELACKQFAEKIYEHIPKEKVRKVLDDLDKEVLKLENADEVKSSPDEYRQFHSWLKKQLLGEK